MKRYPQNLTNPQNSQSRNLGGVRTHTSGQPWKQQDSRVTSSHSEKRILHCPTKQEMCVPKNLEIVGKFSKKEGFFFNTSNLVGWKFPNIFLLLGPHVKIAKIISFSPNYLLNTLKLVKMADPRSSVWVIDYDLGSWPNSTNKLFQNNGKPTAQTYGIYLSLFHFCQTNVCNESSLRKIILRLTRTCTRASWNICTCAQICPDRWKKLFYELSDLV